MAALAGVFLLSASQDPTLSRDMAARLGQLANGTGGANRPDGDEPGPAAPGASGVSPLSELRGWIEARLKSLEELRAVPPDGNAAVIHAPV